MSKELKRVIITAVLIIVVFIGAGYSLYNFVFGRHGIVTRANSVEDDYERTEVYDILSNKIKKKYMDIYNQSKENNEIKLDESYNVDIALASLVEQGALEYYYYTSYDEKTQKYQYAKSSETTPETPKRLDVFWVNTDVMGDIVTVGKGSKYDFENDINYEDVFLIEKVTEGEISTYKLVYYKTINKKQELGVLELEKPLGK